MRDYVDARFRQVTADNNTHFAELRAGIEKLAGAVQDCNQRIAAVPKLWQLVVTIVGAAAGTLTIMLGVTSFGGDRFDAGMGLNAANTETAIAARRTAEETDRRLAEFTRQMAANAAEDDRKLSEFTLLVNTRVEASDRALAEFSRKMDDDDRKFTEQMAASDQKFTELGRRLDANDKKFTELGRRLDANDKKFTELGRRLDANDRKLAGFAQQIDANDRKFTERMTANDRELVELTQQMNANWEKMNASLSRVDALLPALEVIVKGRVYDQPPAPPRR
jgi:hypothetical protein